MRLVHVFFRWILLAYGVRTLATACIRCCMQGVVACLRSRNAAGTMRRLRPVGDYERLLQATQRRCFSWQQYMKRQYIPQP